MREESRSRIDSQSNGQIFQLCKQVSRFGHDFGSAASADRALLRFREALGGAAVEACGTTGITAAEVGSVVLVGGSSLMRVVSDEVRSRVPKAELRASEPFTAAVDGLALASRQAAFG